MSRCSGAGARRRGRRSRWQRHLAEMERRLPGMSTSQNRSLAVVLQEALAETTGLEVLQFSTDLILDPRE